MPEIPAQLISFIVIVGLNLLALILASVEFFNSRYRFLKYAALSQLLAFLWHAFNIRLTFYAQDNATYAISSILIFGSGLYLLAASMYNQPWRQRRLLQIVSVYAVAIYTSSFFIDDFTRYFWYVNYAVFILVPIATLRFFKLPSKWLLLTLQVVLAVTLIVGIPLLEGESFLYGAFFYFLTSIFQPLIAITFITSAVRLSRMEVAKKESEYRAFFESVEEVFFRLDRSGTAITISPSVAQFGVQPDQVIGKQLASFLIRPEYFQEQVELDISELKPFQYDGAFTYSDSSIDCSVACSPILDDAEGGFHFVGSIRNTHERNLLERQLIDAQRRESLGVLAGGVAHDFNNILQGILGHAELLRDFDDLGKEVREQRLDAIVKAADSAGDLCRQLLLYTGRGFEHKEKFDLRDTIHEVVEILKPSHSDAIRINLELGNKAATVEGAKSQIGQIFLNLTKNAMDAVGDAGEITISLRRQTIDSASEHEIDAALIQNLSPGNYLRITVRDSGPGICESIQTKIFDPFFSTKQEGQGLGLAAVSGILKDHKGTIFLHSQPESGTEFTILIPECATPGESITIKPHDSLAAFKNILLVDDDENVRNVASAILGRAGHHIVVARNGVHALEVLESSNISFDLLITDIRMPEMDGVTLARTITAKKPDLPIILSTGYADLTEQLTPAESVKFKLVRKPYRARTLLDTVEEVS